MTQPTTQAIQQAREIVAELYPSSKTAILNGEWDASNSVKVILRALSVSASEREALEARVKELEAQVAKWRNIATDRQYMANAYINMLGPKGLEVAGMWAKKGVQRFHADWTGEAAKLTGEDRAQTILDWEAAPKREVDPREIDGDLPTQPFDVALNGAKP